jgi:pimeloyl-ACP methyl ester carboxylesterase
MFYQDVGEGDPLLLIMGFGGDHLAWALQMADFAARHRVIAFDNRGVGQTDAPDEPYTTRMMAADALGLMDALGVDSAHVLGVSMGGMIAQELVLARPERVRSLHLACTFARPDAYMLALNSAWREMRIGLGRESTLRTLGLWLFSPTTYAERPEFIEVMLENSLANPYPQSLAGFLRQGERSPPTTRPTVSEPSAARRSSASPRTTSSYRRASLARSWPASPAPSSARSPPRAMDTSSSVRTFSTR